MSTERSSKYVSQRPDYHGLAQPADGSIKVRRYISLASLVAILSRKQLPLTRVDLFDDPFEGSVPADYVASTKERFPDPDTQVRISVVNRVARTRIFASCWHANEEESDAMWRLYCPPREGVALQTTYERLETSLPPGPDCALGMVQYIPDSAWSLAHPVSPFTFCMRKRPAFAHEREVRVMFHRSGPMSVTTDHNAPYGVRITGEQMPSFHLIDWNLPAVVENVVVSPHAQRVVSRQRRRSSGTIRPRVWQASSLV
jgi:hypothetical protein